MTAKIIKDMTNEEYHSHPAVSKSGLDEIAKSPYHYWLKFLSEDRPPVQWTDAFTIGSALHALVLEPQNFLRDFAVKEKVDARTKAGKEYNAAFEAENEGKLVLDEQQYVLCQTMTAAIQSHPVAEDYLDGFGEAETSLFWDWNGAPCRCRPDYIRPDGVIIDVKTALSARPNVWQRKAFDFRYHVQAAFYSEGYRACYGENPKAFVFVVVEKSWPHCVLVAEAGTDFLDAGRFDAANDIQTLLACKEADSWPSYNADQKLELGVPSYKRKLYGMEE